MPHEYFDEFSAGQCILMVQASFMSLNIFGDVFFRKYVVFYDKDNNSMTFFNKDNGQYTYTRFKDKNFIIFMIGTLLSSFLAILCIIFLK